MIENDLAGVGGMLRRKQAEGGEAGGRGGRRSLSLWYPSLFGPAPERETERERDRERQRETERERERERQRETERERERETHPSSFPRFHHFLKFCPDTRIQ